MTWLDSQGYAIDVDEDIKLRDLLVLLGSAKSKSEADRLIKAGAVSITHYPVSHPKNPTIREIIDNAPYRTVGISNRPE